jgi:hypothetical protein
LIGWQQTLTTSPANHIHFLLFRAEKSPSGKQVYAKRSCVERSAESFSLVRVAKLPKEEHLFWDI